MAIVDLIMPKMGESIMEATILKWNKAPGDFVHQDESLLDIATDKVDSEVPSTEAGILKEILYPEAAVVQVGSVIARIETEVNTPNVERGMPNAEHAMRNGEHAPESQQRPMPVEETAISNRSTISENRFYSPLVLNIARNEGIALAELEKIPGTGNEGRVTKKDILSFVSHKNNGNGFQERVTKPETTFETKSIGSYNTEKSRVPEFTPVNIGDNVEIQEMDRMRKLIAEHMVRSKHISPHVTSFSEADVTNLVIWREKEKTEFEKREGTKLTLTPLFIEALIKCIKKYPLINSSLQGDKIIIRKDINIGMATALPSGSLIVPVIKNADNYNRVGLARQVNTLASNARNNKLKPEDIQEGTFTLTNVGVFGSLMGTPIINQPQVAILAVGAIKKRPVVIETAEGDAIGIRHMMYLSMSYDHRIIDGSLGASFLTAVAKELESFQG
jgi:2-oxoglutarate dehydrogenase E2 component (dihydrolipoamide succinyltransferase)